MTPQLRAALDKAFDAFAHCEDKDEFARLSGITHPLRELTFDDWMRMDAQFDLAVLLYQEDKDLFRHYLPCWLNWLSDEKHEISIYWDHEDLGNRLTRAGWHYWPYEETEALRRVFEAWTQEELGKHNGKIPIDFLLQVEKDMSRYLDIWLNARPYELAQWLWTIDWSENPNHLRWAVQPVVEKKLESAFFANPDDEHSPLLSRSIQLIRSLHTLES